MRRLVLTAYVRILRPLLFVLVLITAALQLVVGATFAGWALLDAHAHRVHRSTRSLPR
jgi:hypothetical protein